MPHKHETDNIPIPREKDRRVKLTDEQRREIAANAEGLSQRELARRYGVSRRTITFILDPDKLEQNRQRRQERGGSKQYYDKDVHCTSMRVHRRYKALVLIDPTVMLCGECYHAWKGQDACPICNGLDQPAEVWVSADLREPAVPLHTQGGAVLSHEQQLMTDKCDESV